MQIKHVTARKTVNTAFRLTESKKKSCILKPYLHALKKSARQFRRVNVSVPNFRGAETTSGTGKRGTVPKIWRAVPIFFARVNEV